MPTEFNACVRRGGRVRRKTLPDGKYINICSIDGKSYAGEVKHIKEGKVAAAIRRRIR